MKKYKIYLLLLLFLILLVPNINVKAFNLDSKFSGEVIPKYDFMVGEIPNKEDFIITGTLESDGQIYSSLELFVSTDKVPIDQSQTQIIGYVVLENKASAKVTININVIPFNSTLSCNLDNKNITIDSTTQYSDDGFDIAYYYDKIEKIVTNTVGQEVIGSFKFSDNLYNPQLGYNIIAYRFVPSDTRYETTYGNFTVFYDTTPKITMTATSIKLNLNNSKNTYKIKINGKWYTTTKVKNLKANTKYNVTITQKIPNSIKTKVVYTTTVKTKK